jgi:hypothetical protein
MKERKGLSNFWGKFKDGSLICSKKKKINIFNNKNLKCKTQNVKDASHSFTFHIYVSPYY